MDIITQWILAYGYVGLFALLVLGIIGLPIPDEAILTFVGYLVYSGRMHGPGAYATAVLGSVIGISISYSMGRFLGIWLVHRYGAWARITDRELERVHRWFDHYGKWALLWGYFIPGVRHLLAFIAGASKLHPVHFGVYAYAGGLLWASSFITLGYKLGQEWKTVIDELSRGRGIIVSVILVGVVVYLWRRHRGPKRA